MKKEMWIAILVIAALLVAAAPACVNDETDVREPEEPTPDPEAVAAAVEETMAALTAEATTEQPTPTETEAPMDTPTPATFTPEPSSEFQKHTSQDAIEAFVAAGLEAESPTPLDPNEQSPVPKTYVEGQRFLIPSLGEDRGGRAFSFESENELNAIKSYYEGFTGFLGSWVFVKDNLVVQIGNDLPKAKADQYKQVLESLD